MSYYEDYATFQKRIFSIEKPEFSFGMETLVPSGSVRDKVDEDGKFRFFVGDTVVFDLEGSQKKLINHQYIAPLYKVASRCFAEKLREKTFHMTLHDLNASTCADAEVMRRMFATELLLAKKLAENESRDEEICMETTCVFNMVNTSLVLGLKPKSQLDYDKLMSLYMFVEDVHQLSYQFTPHITLAYFRNNNLAHSELTEIERVVNDLNTMHFDITISTSRLYYQRFVSMDKFFNIMPFV